MYCTYADLYECFVSEIILTENDKISYLLLAVKVPQEL